MIGRRSLQIVTGILAIIPVATGLIGLSGIRGAPLFILCQGRVAREDDAAHITSRGKQRGIW